MVLCCSYSDITIICNIMVSCYLFIQDGPQGKVNQDTRLDNRIIDLRVSPLNCSLKKFVARLKADRICTRALYCVSSTDG